MLVEFIREVGENIPLKDLQDNFKVVKLEECSESYIVVHKEESSIFIEFALVCWVSSNSTVEVVFYGQGVGGSLRECRHTWWGEEGDGYIFYPNYKSISAGLKYLTKYFDMD